MWFVFQNFDPLPWMKETQDSELMMQVRRQMHWIRIVRWSAFYVNTGPSVWDRDKGHQTSLGLVLLLSVEELVNSGSLTENSCNHRQKKSKQSKFWTFKSAMTPIFHKLITQYLTYVFHGGSSRCTYTGRYFFALPLETHRLWY